jgi:hypothetical protein
MGKSKDGVYLSLEADGGVSLRLDKEPRGFDTEEPLDMTFSVGGWFSPTRRYAVALAYRSMGLGGARSAASDEDIAVQRDLGTLWLGGRAYPVLGDQLGIFVQLELGGTGNARRRTGQPKACRLRVRPRKVPPWWSARAQAPMWVLDGSVSFIAVVDGAAHRLGHDVVDGCAPGSGSVVNMTAQVGFGYRIDLSGEPTG